MEYKLFGLFMSLILSIIMVFFIMFNGAVDRQNRFKSLCESQNGEIMQLTYNNICVDKDGKIIRIKI